jgi:hypothetical protein
VRSQIEARIAKRPGGDAANASKRNEGDAANASKRVGGDAAKRPEAKESRAGAGFKFRRLTSGLFQVTEVSSGGLGCRF